MVCDIHSHHRSCEAAKLSSNTSVLYLKNAHNLCGRYIQGKLGKTNDKYCGKCYGNDDTNNEKKPRNPLQYVCFATTFFLCGKKSHSTSDSMFRAPVAEQKLV